MYLKLNIWRTFFTVSLSVVTILMLSAQTSYQEFEKILAVYQGEKTVSYQIEYYYFSDLETDVASDSMTFNIAQNKVQTYMDTPSVTIFQGKNRHLTIDKEEKHIYIQATAPSSTFDLGQIKQTTEKLGLALQLVTVDDKQNRLVFKSPNTNTRIELVYSLTNYRLISSLIQMDEKGDDLYEFNETRFEARYSNHKHYTKFPYAISTFIRQKGKTWKGIGQYQEYEISML